MNPMPDDFAFPFERLTAYRLLVDVARWVRTVRWPAGDAKLRDQAGRAAASAVLNLAEGCQIRGGQGANQRRIAAASAAEVCDGPAQQHKLRRAGAMIRKLR